MTETRKTAGVIAPPPLLFAAPLALAVLGERALGGPWIGFPDWAHVVSVALVVAALALALGAIVALRRAQTAVEPWKPTSALVTDGVYRFTRNPIYLGFALVYVGVALWYASALALALLLPLLALVELGVIRREERYLDGLFGEAYLAYRARTRRWI